MLIEIIIDGETKTVIRQELFDLAAQGRIEAHTPVNIDGKLTTADKIDGIAFNTLTPPPIHIAPPPLPTLSDRRLSYSQWIMPGAIVVLLLACIALLLGSMFRTTEGVDTAQKPVPDQAAIEEPAVFPIEPKADDVPQEPLPPDHLDIPEQAMEPVDVPDDEMPPENVPDVVEDAGNMPEPDPVDDDTVQKDDKPDIEPTPNDADMGRFRIIETTPEPLELTEARQLYDEKVEQAIKPYREELEKELATAKEQGELQVVLKLEAELKQIRAAKLTEAKPEKRSLASTKVRCRKDIETTRETYKKRLMEIVKELTQSDRIEEAKLVQEQIDHFDKPRSTMLTPKRITTPALPVVRMLLEINPNGKGRFVVGKGMSTDALAPISGEVFPLTGLPKAQAFRGEKGRDRLVIDFRDADPQDAWKNGSFGHWFHYSGIDLQRRSMCFYVAGSQNWPAMGVHMQPPPCRVICDIVDGPLIPSLAFELFKNKSKGVAAANTPGEVKCWVTSDSGKWLPDGTYRLPNSQENHKLIFSKQNEFQLPKAMVDDLAWVQFNMQVNPGNVAEGKVDLILLDLNGKFFTKIGMTVSEGENGPVVESVRSKWTAFRVGLRKGDEIVRFNGTKRTASEIMDILNGVQFGDLLTVVVIRDGEEKAFRFHAE